MKFCRFGARGSEKPGVVDAQGVLRDLSGKVDRLTVAAIASLGDFDVESLPVVLSLIHI